MRKSIWVGLWFACQICSVWTQDVKAQGWGGGTVVETVTDSSVTGNLITSPLSPVVNATAPGGFSGGNVTGYNATTNTYYFGYTSASGTPGYLLKVNSSGTLQWQRKFSIDNSVDLQANITNIVLDETDSSVALTFNPYNTSLSTATIRMVIKYPMDGSITGSYSVGTASLTIASGDATVSSGTVTLSDSIYKDDYVSIVFKITYKV